MFYRQEKGNLSCHRQLHVRSLADWLHGIKSLSGFYRLRGFLPWRSCTQPQHHSHHVPLSSVTFNPRLGLSLSSANQNYLCISYLQCVRKVSQPSLHFITNDIDERRLRKRILFERHRFEGIFESKKNAVSYRFLAYLTTFCKCVASVRNTYRLMPHREIIGVYCKSHTEHLSTLCGQMQNL